MNFSFFVCLFVFFFKFLAQSFILCVIIYFSFFLLFFFFFGFDFFLLFSTELIIIHWYRYPGKCFVVVVNLNISNSWLINQTNLKTIKQSKKKTQEMNTSLKGLVLLQKCIQRLHASIQVSLLLLFFAFIFVFYSHTFTFVVLHFKLCVCVYKHKHNKHFGMVYIFLHQWFWPLCHLLVADVFKFFSTSRNCAMLL